MKRHKSIYFFVFLFVSLSLKVNSQKILDIYLETAATNNPALKARFNEYQATLQVVPQVGSLPDPRVSFGYFIRPVETRAGPQQARLSATQMFPWFGTLNAEENSAIQIAKAKYEAFEEAKSNLFYEVKSAYYDLYVIRKAISITTENINILNTFYRLAMTKIEAGSASAVDGLRTEMETADMENQLALLKDSWLAQSVKFNKLLNIENISTIELPDTLWNTDLLTEKSTVLDSIKSGNHQLAGMEFKSEALNYRELVASRSGKPGFSIGIDYIITGTTDNAMVDNSINGKDAVIFPVIGITIPLYRNKYKAMVQEAVYLQQANEEQKAEKTNLLETVLEMAYKEYSDAGRRITLFSNQKVLAAKALRILESEYTSAEADFEDMLSMERKVLMYSLELEKARADKQASVAFIYYLMGK